VARTLVREGIRQDAITDSISKKFDLEFSGTSEFRVPYIGDVPADYQIGLIVGPSGSGKSTLLKSFGVEDEPQWDADRAIVSHFKDADDGHSRLSAVGLNSVPSWFKPYQILSTGEKFRANLSRKLLDGCVVDEFTSVVDRSVAKSCSYAIRRFADATGLKRMVFASCHYDIIEWLQPDWVFDTLTSSLTIRGSVQRPDITLEVLPCGPEAWAAFRHHHYLSGDLNRSGRHWLCVWESVAVGFTSVMALPSGTLRNAYRGHRTVVLPDYQGLGIGVRLSDAIGEIQIGQGRRYFSKTVHPRMGEYRNRSPLWRATSKNMRVRSDHGSNTNMTGWSPRQVLAYSHEYVGHVCGAS
jgi:GNAT superfamily N-acetyltransferase